MLKIFVEFCDKNIFISITLSQKSLTIGEKKLENL